MTTTAADLLQLDIDSPFVDVEPGGEPVTLSVGFQNKSSIVDRFTVYVAGLDPKWFSLSSTAFSLFPGDREQINLTIQPPARRADLRAGTYPFQVSVRASGGASGSVTGHLVIRGAAIFRVELLPQRRVSHSRGRFVVRVVNDGLAAGRIALQARDREDACRFSFRENLAPLIDAGETLDLPLDVTPVKRPFVGPERSYDFEVRATPEREDGSTEPITATGVLVHQPRLPSLAPFWRAARWSLVPIAAVAAFNLVPLQMRCAIPGNGPELPLIGQGCPRPVVAQLPQLAPAPAIAAQLTPTQAPFIQEPLAAAVEPPVLDAQQKQANLPAPPTMPPAQPMQAAAQMAPAQPLAELQPPVAMDQMQPARPVQKVAQPLTQPAPVQPATQPQVQPQIQPKTVWDVFATACGQTQFKRPSAIVLDRQANLFIADTDNNRLVKLSPKGVCLDQWQIDRPARFALDNQGNAVYLTDTTNSRLLKLTLQSRKLETVASMGRQPGQLDRPAGIVVDKDNNIIVADFGNNRVQKLSAQGKPVVQWAVKGATDVALETDGDVYATGAAANANQTLVLKLTKDGKTSPIFTSTSALDVTSDTKGNVFGTTVSDIRKLSDEGQAQTVTLALPNGPFATPPSFAFDDQGKVFLVSSATGQILTPR